MLFKKIFVAGVMILSSGIANAEFVDTGWKVSGDVPAPLLGGSMALAVIMMGRRFSR